MTPELRVSLVRILDVLIKCLSIRQCCPVLAFLTHPPTHLLLLLLQTSLCVRAISSQLVHGTHTEMVCPFGHQVD